MKKLLSMLLAAVLAVALTVPAAASAAKSISFGIGEIKLTVGSTRQLNVRWSPRDAVEEDLTWRSSDDSVATVDSDGLITAHKRGEAIISAKSERGLRAGVRVTVRDEGQKISAKGLEMLITTMRMQVDQTRLLVAYFVPSDTTDQDITWSSDNTNVATVNPEGEVTSIAPGTAVITATASNGEYATCTVTVSTSVLGSAQRDSSVNQTQNSSVTLTSAAARTAVEEAAAATKKGEVGTAVFRNKTKVTPTVIGAAAYSARSKERDIRLRFRTETEEGKLQGHLTFDPQQLPESNKNDVGVAVYNASNRAASARERCGKNYRNTLDAFELNHSGSFGFAVDVVVKPTTTGLSASQLHFYQYTTGGSVKELSVENARIDKNGYLHFTTTQGGVIVVSNGALQK